MSYGVGSEVPEQFLGGTTKLTGPLTTEEMEDAKNSRIMKVQKSTSTNIGLGSS